MPTKTIPTRGSYSPDKLHSDSLNLLRFPLTVVVLIIHVVSNRGTLLIHGSEYSIEEFPLFAFLNHLFYGTLHDACVPIFYFISGHVFFMGTTLTRDVYRRKLQSRVRTLLRPYIIWNLVALFQAMLFYYCLPSSLFSNPRIINYSLSGFLNTFWDKAHGIILTAMPSVDSAMYPQNIPLWYVRDLMIVVLLTPLINYLLRHGRQYFLSLLGVAWFVSGLWKTGHVGMLLTAFFFFSWGAYMSIFKKDMLTAFGKYSRLSAILFVSLGLLYVASVYYCSEAMLYIKRMNIIVSVIFVYNLAVWLLKRDICRPNPFLLSATFFVYVTHIMICGNIEALFRKLITSPSSLLLLADHALTTLLTLAVLLVLFAFMQRFTPRLLTFLVGRK